MLLRMSGTHGVTVRNAGEIPEGRPYYSIRRRYSEGTGAAITAPRITSGAHHLLAVSVTEARGHDASGNSP